MQFKFPIHKNADSGDVDFYIEFAAEQENPREGKYAWIVNCPGYNFLCKKTDKGFNVEFSVKHRWVIYDTTRHDYYMRGDSWGHKQNAWIFNNVQKDHWIKKMSEFWKDNPKAIWVEV